MTKRRTPNKSAYNKEQEYDKTREMLDMMRGKKNRMNEQEEETAMSDEYVEKDPMEGGDAEALEAKDRDMDDQEAAEDVVELNASEMKEEKDKFRDSVDSRVEFYSFKIYPKSKNAVFSGSFAGLGGMHWQFTLEEKTGIYLSVDNLQLDDDTFEVLEKLKGYYENWAEEWSEKVVEEYSGSADEEEDEEDAL